MRVTPPETLREEVAFVAYHFGWDRETVLSLSHRERRQWCDQISAINDRRNEQAGDADRSGGGIELTNPAGR
ncbi:DUF6760 family protein [Halapricum sp. CBA1109]|uniref:DUF6760 family protein n=1 Tax=Halapricum sp. CBA1109 TaxID=2668068 RepID=UPI0012FC44C9|nr:DUF6760 family protein [Halapricum sp. CBA1109]